jgi:MFS family permease
MPSTAEISEQVARETERRNRLAVPAFGGGFLYLISAIIIASTTNAAPTVGLLQGLAPALSGVANPAVSPRTPGVKFISSHAFALIAGGVLSAISLAVLTLILLLLASATSFRRPQSWRGMRMFLIIGGVGLILTSVGHQVVSAIETHKFAVGHDHTNHAVEQALLTSTANAVVGYIELLAGLALVAGMIATSVNALRVGLLPRWMGMLGVFTSLLIFLPDIGAELQVIPAFWIVMMGILLVGRWPKPTGDPPAWAAGVAMPWPPRGGAKAGGAQAVAAVSGAGTVPAPVLPTSGGSSRKRRRKRG